jgi:hypothetical protein
MDSRWARPWFAITVACIATGIIIPICLAPNATDSFGGSPLNRALNVFAFFTIQSNLLVGIACVLLVIKLDRQSFAFAVLRLTGLIGITVTFVVFHVALARLLDLDGWAQAGNQFQHTISPIMAIVGWLCFGPRGLTSRRAAVVSIIFPVLYFAFCLIRGPLASHWYPYPFIDVQKIGYGPVLVNGVWIALLFIGVGTAATALDAKLPGVRVKSVGDDATSAVGSATATGP